MIRCVPGMKLNLTDEVVMIDGEAYVMNQKEYREYREKQMTEELSHLYIAMRMGRGLLYGTPQPLDVQRNLPAL